MFKVNGLQNCIIILSFPHIFSVSKRISIFCENCVGFSLSYFLVIIVSVIIFISYFGISYAVLVKGNSICIQFMDRPASYSRGLRGNIFSFLRDIFFFF